MTKIQIQNLEFSGAELFIDSENFLNALDEEHIEHIKGGEASPIDLTTNPIVIPCPNPTKPVLHPLPCTPLIL